MEPNTPNPHPFETAMAAVLHSAGAGQVVEACNRVAAALEAVASSPPAEVPEGIRSDIHRVAALLTLPTWAEVVKLATASSVDLRDLTSKEFAYIEQVEDKTVAKWRSQGTGPLYRCEGKILYPLEEVYQWRRKGRQRMVSQKPGKRRAED
jgi:hypothetical protein